MNGVEWGAGRGEARTPPGADEGRCCSASSPSPRPRHAALRPHLWGSWSLFPQAEVGGRERLWLRPRGTSGPRVAPALALPPPSRKPQEYRGGWGRVHGSRRCPTPPPPPGQAGSWAPWGGPGHHVLPQAPSPIRRACPCSPNRRPCRGGSVTLQSKLGKWAVLRHAVPKGTKVSTMKFWWPLEK